MVAEQCLVNFRCSVLLIRAASILLCRRSGPPEFWTLPGGSPEEGEGATAAAVREVYEETGLKVTVSHVLTVFETVRPDGSPRRLDVVFRGQERDFSAAPRRLEIDLAPAFVPLDALDKTNLMPPIVPDIRALATTAAVSDKATGAAWLSRPWREAAPEPS